MAPKAGFYFSKENILHAFLRFDNKFNIVRRTEVAKE